MLASNLHTHTYRCGHATGDVKDYVKVALRRGLTTLGFSDHMPHPENRWKRVRMGLSELSGYCKAIQLAKERFPQIRIFGGLECEYDEAFHSYYTDTLLGEYKMDYLVGGAHWFPYQGKYLDVCDELLTPAHLAAYAGYLSSAMETGFFAFIAHPDMFARSHTRWDANAIAASREIIGVAEKTDTPLEINGYGFRKKWLKTDEGIVRPMYPIEAFWRLAAEYNVRVIVNSDAHAPRDVADLERGYNLAKKFGLKVVELEF